MDSKITTKIIKMPVMADGLLVPGQDVFYKGMRVVGYDLFRQKFDLDGSLVSSVKIKRVFTAN
jgi:hypothetical protein